MTTSQTTNPITPPRARNLVIGMSWGLALDDLLLFSKSLRRFAPEVDIVLFVKDVTVEAQRLALELNIQLLPLTSCYYGMCRSSAKREFKASVKRIRNYVGLRLFRLLFSASRPLLRLGYTREEFGQLQRETNKLVCHTYSSRFVQYYDYLKNQELRYEKVMLTDVRDVCFQADPFAAVPADQLWMFQEEGPATLGTEKRNGQWIKATFGSRVLRQIAEHRILCAGITIGGYKNILGYLQTMEPHLLTRTPAYIPDQGIHNALAYTGAFNHLNPVIRKNGEGPVLTVGLMNQQTMILNAEGRLVDSQGKPYAVIHQYDRHEYLIPHLKKLAGNG